MQKLEYIEFEDGIYYQYPRKRAMNILNRPLTDNELGELRYANSLIKYANELTYYINNDNRYDLIAERDMQLQQANAMIEKLLDAEYQYAKGGKISQEDKDRVLDNIDKEGIDYGIREYDEYTDIKDNQFQKLRKDYIVRAKQLERQAKKDEYYNDLVDNEGLDYTFTEYVDPEEVENEELKKKIKAYEKAKDRLLDYLGTRSKVEQVEYLKDDELLVPLRTGIGMFADGGRINIVDEDVKFDKSKYRGALGDFDADGIANIDDAKPLTNTGTQETVEQVQLSKTFNQLLKLKSQLNDTMNMTVDELDEISPSGAQIYARTKTPYSILKKLVDKRLTNKELGLTDLVGTTVAVDDLKDLKRVDRAIKGGALGKVVEREDMYANPKAGYRAVHYLIEADDYIVEVQLKTKRQKELNVLSHDAYKSGNLNEKYLLKLTDLANKADKGNKNAIKEFDTIMKNKNKVVDQLNQSFGFGGEITRSYDITRESGVGTYAVGGKVSEAGDTDYPSELLNYAKGGKTDTYVAITLVPKKTAYKGGKGEVYKNMEAFYDTINSNEDKYPFVHYISVMDSRKSDPTDISEVRVYMVGEKSGFDKVEKKGLYDLFDLKKSSEKVKKYARGGKTQGYNARLDESLGERTGAEINFEQKRKDRRDESKAMEKASGKRAYSSVRTMDKGNRMLDHGGMLAQVGELFDADTEVEYARGGQVSKGIVRNQEENYLLRLAISYSLNRFDNADRDTLDKIYDRIVKFSNNYGKMAQGGELFDADTEVEYARGGRNKKRDDMFLSKEEHEKAYSGKRKKMRRYKKRKK